MSERDALVAKATTTPGIVADEVLALRIAVRGLQEQVATLTDERDAAVAQVSRLLWPVLAAAVVDDLAAQAATLTAERDEARALLQAARRLLATLDGGLDDMTMEVRRLREQVATLTAERDAARAKHGTDVHNLMQRQLEVLHERDAAQREVERLRAEVRRITEEGLRQHAQQPSVLSSGIVGPACPVDGRWEWCDDHRRYASLAALCDPQEAAREKLFTLLAQEQAVEAQEEGE